MHSGGGMTFINKKRLKLALVMPSPPFHYQHTIQLYTKRGLNVIS